MPVAGIDVGSLSAEAVIMRGDEVLGYSILPTGADSRGAAEKALAVALENAHMTAGDLAFIVATGYGRISVPFANKRVTEITCHAKGAHFLFPKTRTVIDIGGQDSKVIQIDESGRVVDFAMNDKCAAGTGRFLEVMARALEVDLEAMGDLSKKSRKHLVISSMCTVFAESEVVSLIARGEAKEDIISALHESVAERVSSLAQRVGVLHQVTMTGGVAKNEGVVRSLGQKLGMPMNIPPEPQIVGALGAAIISRELADGAGR
ncbi:MAG TPA: 2-hydroxyglutaryl-CoA dehydratase [Firmicutes bacterium]|nr:2-hydroxyglutaryl-CoA dehydratase [Bacillota bacterium]